MAPQRYPQHQVLDPFAALGYYHVHKQERAVQALLTERACHSEPHRTILTYARDGWASLRQRGMVGLRIARRRPA